MKVKIAIVASILLTFLIMASVYLFLKIYVPDALIPFDEFGKIPLCNRKIERGIIINGFVLPLCSRCTFMLLFFVFSLVLTRIKFLNRLITSKSIITIILITTSLVLPLIVDGVRVYFFKHHGSNLVRMITGALFGIGVGIFTHYLIYFLFERKYA